MSKQPPELGFDLDELEQETSRYRQETIPRKAGRPPMLHKPRSCSFRLPEDQYQWLIKEAARRTLATGKRWDASMIVRELIDKARSSS
ncbi:hypothetical protein [Methylomarinovum tepidoasis]|uniref:hypothetical protein n=1 Tax=Methylomarinovum tepidoasis TaxID=2840183 RepID=UPI00257370CE|nr:hypothetical protein [Methylomarinovum sp. IN45]